MSKFNSINWRKSDEKKLKKSIKNFNAKIDRQVKKGENINALPEKLNYNKIRKETTNRKDFNKIIRESDKFRQRGSEKIITNEYGIQKTKFEIEQIKKDVQRINRERKKKADSIKNGTFTVAGEIISKQEINTIKKNFNFEKIKSYSNFAKYAESVKKQAMYNYDEKTKTLFFENIINGLKNGLGEENVKEIVNRINKIGQEKFVNLLKNEKLIDVDFFYSPVSIDDRISAIEEFIDYVEQKEDDN